MFRTRYGVAILASAVITMGLFLFMKGLITNNEPPKQTVVTKIWDGLPKVRPPVKDQPKSVLKRPEKPPEADLPPLDLPVATNPGKGKKLDIVLPPRGPILTGPPSSDRQAIPLVTAPPVFPARAKTGGWVILQFDIAPTGSVENVEVIDSSSAIFNRSATKAIKKWKFKAKVVNGEKVWQYGKEFRITYEFNDEA